MSQAEIVAEDKEVWSEFMHIYCDWFVSAFFDPDSSFLLMVIDALISSYSRFVQQAPNLNPDPHAFNLSFI